MIEKPVTDLPEPDSPTRPSTSPRLQRQRHAVHRVQRAVARRELGDEVAHFEQRVRMRRHLASLGFSTSRNWSPTRLIARIVASSAMPG